MRLFLAGTSFYDHYGGPAVSVANLAAGLAAAGAEVAVWAPDGSARRNPKLAATRGLTPLAGPLRAAWRDAGPVDLIHDNGLWLPHNHRLANVARRASLPRLVSVRGMLEPWAFDYRRAKKRLAWALYQRRDLERAALLHATSDSEAGNIARFGLEPPLAVIPNGIAIGPPPPDRPPRAAGDPKTLLFLGRVHPIKALGSLMEAWSTIRPEGWRLRIVGSDEVGHVADLRAHARALGLAAKVEFQPPVAQADTPALLQASDALVLCSHSENFGMSVAEALLQEVPVITSRGTPWSIVADQRCGWWVDNGVAGLAGGLAALFATDPAELRAMGRRGRRMIEGQFSIASVCDRFLALYEKLLREPNASSAASSPSASPGSTWR